MNSEPRLKVVVEGPSDAQIVRGIAGKDLARRLRVFGGQGRASLATVGRNLLVHEGGPVLLVMDSDTLNPQLTAELQSINIVALSGAVSSGVPLPEYPAWPARHFQVFTFVPEIEAVFFESPGALERVLGRKPPPEKVREGHLAPKETLCELIRSGNGCRDYPALLAGLDQQTWDAIVTGKQAKALKACIESMLAAPAKV
jgi:hypothetical protein